MSAGCLLLTVALSSLCRPMFEPTQVILETHPGVLGLAVKITFVIDLDHNQTGLYDAPTISRLRCAWVYEALARAFRSLR